MINKTELLYVRIRTNSLGDYSSGYGWIAYVVPQAICPDIFLAKVQFRFAQAAQLRWMSWPLDANYQTFNDYRQLLNTLNTPISCNFIKGQQKNRDERRTTRPSSMPILRMLASTGEEHRRPTPRGCDLIKGIITLSELVTVNYLCYDYTYTIVISPLYS